MNLHPIFVHFPIALLTLYSLAELLRFRALMAKAWWFYVKASAVVVGAAAAALAYATGDSAVAAIGRNPILRPIIRAHESWAAATMLIYGLIALIYFLAFLEKEGIFDSLERLWARARPDGKSKILLRLTKFLRYSILPSANKAGEGWMVVVLALAGLAAVTVTGALGGSIVYGPNVDPVVQIVYRLLGL